jgi:hypothetical protein
MEKIRFLFKSKIQDYNNKAIKNKYNRSINKSYLENLPRRDNKNNLIKYPIIHSQLQDNDLIRCLVITSGKFNHISLDMSLKDYKLLPLAEI